MNNLRNVKKQADSIVAFVTISEYVLMNAVLLKLKRILYINMYIQIIITIPNLCFLKWWFCCQPHTTNLKFGLLNFNYETLPENKAKLESFAFKFQIYQAILY